MSASKQPFTDHVTRTKQPAGRGSRVAVWVLAGLCVILLLAAITFGSAMRREQAEAAALRARATVDKTDLTALQARDLEQQQALATLRAHVADLEREKEMATQMARSLEDEMRAELESKDVTISKLQGKLTVNILDRILFDSGEAILRTEGEAVLQKIAAFLAQHPELKIHVIGHTDNVPMRPSAKNRFASNWELSTARALAAVRFLTERAGVAPQRLGAVGYGEFRPIADNATAEGRARNRRIAITILADELAGADVAPALQAAVKTNAPVLTPVPPNIPGPN